MFLDVYLTPPCASHGSLLPGPSPVRPWPLSVVCTGPSTITALRPTQPGASVSKTPSHALVIQLSEVPKWPCVPISPPEFRNQAVLCVDVGIMTFFLLCDSWSLGTKAWPTLSKYLMETASASLHPPFLKAQTCGNGAGLRDQCQGTQ